MSTFVETAGHEKIVWFFFWKSHPLAYMLHGTGIFTYIYTPEV